VNFYANEAHGKPELKLYQVYSLSLGFVGGGGWTGGTLYGKHRFKFFSVGLVALGYRVFGKKKKETVFFVD
jgi:hypothetical protein